MSEMKTIRQVVLETVARGAGFPVSDVEPEKSLEAHGLDSLDRVEFLMAAEDAFHLEIPDTDGQRLDNQPVQEWIQYMEARRAAAAV